MVHKKLEKQLRKEGKVKKEITISKETAEKWKTGIHAINVTNMNSKSKSTISTTVQREDLYEKLMLLKVLLKLASHDQQC